MLAVHASRSDDARLATGPPGDLFIPLVIQQIHAEEHPTGRGEPLLAGLMDGLTVISTAGNLSDDVDTGIVELGAGAGGRRVVAAGATPPRDLLRSGVAR